MVKEKEIEKRSIEEELWYEYKKTGDKRIRDQLLLQHAQMVKYIAGRLAVNMPPNIEFEDLVSYGVMGLLDAIEKYDPSRGIKFKTYATQRVRGHIIDQLRDKDWIPRSTRQKYKEIEKAYITLEARLGRPATDKEVAEELGISEEEFNKRLNEVSFTTMISIDDTWLTGKDNDDISIADTIEASPTTQPENQIIKEDIKKILIEAIKKLPKKEYMVIALYYYEELTLKEIGEVLGVTESRVSQLHTKAVMHLKSKLMAHKEILM